MGDRNDSGAQLCVLTYMDRRLKLVLWMTGQINYKLFTLHYSK